MFIGCRCVDFVFVCFVRFGLRGCFLMACFWFDCLVVYFVLYIGFVGGWFPVYFV